ncbi:MAG: hypothetical protein LBD78_00820 [Spirochaetaceae bacterium]|jgi:hypothetical protein|nr:hypothetical protein [Spirochaetaceae bacterium]
MKTITCDICKRTITQPVVERDYFHIGHRDICESCKDQLDLVAKPVIRTKQPFNYEWYNQFVQDSIEKSIVRGKVEVR